MKWENRERKIEATTNGETDTVRDPREGGRRRRRGR